jgi:hypothetical protein
MIARASIGSEVTTTWRLAGSGIVFFHFKSFIHELPDWSITQKPSNFKSIIKVAYFYWLSVDPKISVRVFFG